MGRSAGIFSIVFALSLGAWTVLYLASSPPTPPGGAETLMLVGVVGALVFGVDRLLARFRTRKSGRD